MKTCSSFLIEKLHAWKLPCLGRTGAGIRFSIINGWPAGGHGGGFSLHVQKLIQKRIIDILIQSRTEL